MIFYGIGEILGPLLMGLSCDRLGNIPSVIILALISLSGVGGLIYYNE